MNYQDPPLNKIMILCSLCLSLFWVTPVMSEGFSSGVFEFQKKLATSGNPQAQYKLGAMYEAGRGVTADANQALEWYKKSAAQNVKPANDRITYLEVKKSGYNADKHGNWLNGLKQSAAAGDGEAMMLLGQLYKQGIGVPRNLTKAQTMFSDAAKKDIAGTEIELENTAALIKSEQKKALAQKQRNAAAKQAKQAAAKKQAQQKALANRKKQAQLQAKENQRLAREKATQQQKVALERKKLEIEKKKLKLEKRKLARQQKILKQQQLQKQKAATESQGYQKEACRGNKAKFLTVCQ